LLPIAEKTFDDIKAKTNKERINGKKLSRLVILIIKKVLKLKYPNSNQIIIIIINLGMI
jgi:hypothetical protein